MLLVVAAITVKFHRKFDCKFYCTCDWSIADSDVRTMPCEFLDPETGRQALPTLLLFLLGFFLLSDFQSTKALSFLNRSS